MRITGAQNFPPLHGRNYQTRAGFTRILALLVSALLVFVGTITTCTWLDFSITAKSRGTRLISQGDRYKQTDLIDVNSGKPIDILVLGSDSRDGAINTELGGSNDGDTSMRSDTAIVIQISADRSYINMVSIPRDSLVNAPSCQTSKGVVPSQHNVMFNSIFASGWEEGGDLASAATCSLNAVNSLTGMHIENFINVDFSGMKNMLDAIGGVDLCIPTDMRDNYTGPNLKKGFQHLDGTQATQYARTRYVTGTDGTDIMRTTRQQYLVRKLLDGAMSKQLFKHPTQLYRLGKSSLESLNISSGLADASVLAGLAMSIKRHGSQSLIFSNPTGHSSSR